MSALKLHLYINNTLQKKHISFQFHVYSCFVSIMNVNMHILLQHIINSILLYIYMNFMNTKMQYNNLMETLIPQKRLFQKVDVQF